MLHKAAVVVGLVLACSAPQALADPVDDYTATYGVGICKTLDDIPTVSQIKADVEVLIEHAGLSEQDAGGTIAQSIHDRCPQYQVVLIDFINAYSHKLERV